MLTDEPMDPTTRLITFDWYQELGRKMGFIRSIPNITKIPQPIFDQIMSDPVFHFEIKKAIPMTEWEWKGEIVAKERVKQGYVEVPVFKLNTTVGDFDISTVGSRWRLQTFRIPTVGREVVANTNELIRAERDVMPTREQVLDEYETRVFYSREGRILVTKADLEAMQTLSQEEATAWHYIFCAYYSVLEKE